MPDNIYIKPIYIYNQLEMRAKLRTRQIYIYNKYTYTQGCLSASDGPSSEHNKNIHIYNKCTYTQGCLSAGDHAASPLAIMLPLLTHI